MNEVYDLGRNAFTARNASYRFPAQKPSYGNSKTRQFYVLNFEYIQVCLFVVVFYVPDIWTNTTQKLFCFDF